MSSMWNISVLDKGSMWVDLQVYFAHPDAGGFPDDPVFGLLLLTQEAYSFNSNSERIPNGSLGKAIDFDKSYLPDDVEDIADNFIKDVVIYQTENLPWDEDAAHEKMNALCRAKGLSKEDSEWEDAWDEFWVEFWKDSDNLPWAKYRIRVTDSKWIDHLRVGQRYDSAAFSFSGPWIRENILVAIEKPSDGQALPGVPEFKDSEIPPRGTDMNLIMIRRLSESKGFISEDQLTSMLEKHKLFLSSGGEGGRWECLQTSGLPINLYESSASKGEQLKLSMRHVNPSSAILKGSNMSFSDLSGAILEKVDLSGVTLNGSLLTYAFFSGVNFNGASLEGVDFTGSDLTGASFRNANLRNTDFEITNCQRADFTGADLTGSSFKGAVLKDIKR